MIFGKTSRGNGVALGQTTPDYNFPYYDIHKSTVGVCVNIHICDAGT